MGSPEQEDSSDECRSMWSRLRRVILGRRSTRLFSRSDGKAVAPRIVQDVIKFARQTASILCDPGCFEVITIEDPAIKERLANEMKGKRQSSPADAKVVLLVLVHRYAEAVNREAILVSAGAFIESMLLRATAHGVDSLWLSSFFDDLLMDICGIQSRPLRPVAVICLGCRRGFPRVANRVTMAKRVSFETFDPTRHASNKEVAQDSRPVNNPEHLSDNFASSGLLGPVASPTDYIEALDHLADLCDSPFPHPAPVFGMISAIENLQEAVRWAPSAKNFQSPYLVIAQDTDLVQALKVAHRLHVNEDVAAAVLLLGALERFKMLGKGADDAVPHYPSTTPERGTGLFVYLDAGAALQNMSLSLLAMGYRPKWVLDTALSGLVAHAVRYPSSQFSFHGMLLILGSAEST